MSIFRKKEQPQPEPIAPPTEPFTIHFTARAGSAGTVEATAHREAQEQTPEGWSVESLKMSDISTAVWYSTLRPYWFAKCEARIVPPEQADKSDLRREIENLADFWGRTATSGGGGYEIACRDHERALRAVLQAVKKP